MDGAQCDSGNLQPGGEELRGPYWTKGASNDSSTPTRRRAAGHRNCNLNQVDWVIPTASNPTCRIYRRLRTSWVSSIINAVGYSPCTDLVNGQPLTYWQDTVILVTWTIGRLVRSRSPATSSAAAPAIASSYAYGFAFPCWWFPPILRRNGRQQHRGLDFGTILKFIEEVFNLSNINSVTWAVSRSVVERRSQRFLPVQPTAE